MPENRPIDTSPRRENSAEHPPVLSSWYEAYDDANTRYPQSFLGIVPVVGASILDSLGKKEVDWQYVSQSRFTKKQIDEEKLGVTRKHRAIGVKVVAEEYMDVTRGERPGITDDTITGIWNAGRQHITKACYSFATWSMQDTYPDIDPRYSRMAYVASHMNETLQKFFSDPKYQPQVEMLSGLFTAAKDALDTSEGKAMTKAHIGTYDERKGGAPVKKENRRETPPMQGLENLITKGVATKVNEIVEQGTMIPWEVQRMFLEHLTAEEEKLRRDDFQ